MGNKLRLMIKILTIQRAFLFINTRMNIELAYFLTQIKIHLILFTYIKWSEIDTDTLKCEMDRNGNSGICKKVWLNNELVWQAYDTERFFVIIN